MNVARGAGDAGRYAASMEPMCTLMVLPSLDHRGTSNQHATWPAATLALVAANFLSWFAVSWLLSLPLLRAHNSYFLLRASALNADLLYAGQWWRVITSQFLHVHFAHLIFNMAALLLLGAALERHLGPLHFVLLYAVGGSIGQLAGVASTPSLVSSGASQAVMAVAGARAVGLLRGRAGGLAPTIILLTVVGVQLGLDMLVAGTFKAGHWSGLCAGASIGYLLGRRQGNRARGITTACTRPRIALLSCARRRA